MSNSAIPSDDPLGAILNDPEAAKRRRREKEIEQRVQALRGRQLQLDALCEAWNTIYPQMYLDCPELGRPPTIDEHLTIRAHRLKRWGDAVRAAGCRARNALRNWKPTEDISENDEESRRMKFALHFAQRAADATVSAAEIENELRRACTEDSDEQKRTQFRYELSMFQLEYSRNFLFNRGRELEQIFQGLIDRTRATLDIKTVKTILGCKQRPQKRGKTRWEITVETPEYGLTIFKVHAGTLSLKMYTKRERVLRCEIMLHNARVLKLGTSLERWPAVTGQLQGVLERFLEVVQCADAASIDDGTFDALPQSSQVGRSRMAGLHLTSPRLALVLDAVLALATKTTGFTSGDLARQVRQTKSAPDDYQSRHAAYDLKKLRGKKLVEKIGGSRRYQAPAEGLRTMVALVMLRDKVLKPVLRNRNLQGPPPRNNNPIDHHYYNLRQEMRRLFRSLEIAA